MIRDADIFYNPIFLNFYISIKHFYDGGILQIHGGNELINSVFYVPVLICAYTFHLCP